MAVPHSPHHLNVAMPSWNALYQVRDFGYRVRDVRAVGDISANPGSPIPKLDNQTWSVEYPPPGLSETSDMDVSYSIEWNDPGPFNSQINDHHAFINLAEILMYVPDRRSEDTEVAFENIPASWKIASELPAGKEPSSFTAASYDALVDAPVEAGNFNESAFDNAGAHFRVVVDADNWNNSQRNKLEDALRRITGYELQLMGGPPFKEYTFFFHIGSQEVVGGGGMEHANSCAIASTSLDRAIHIAAHEFFHAWNVKRIRPQALEPVDYTREQYTRALWFAEGVTSTYATYALERTGLWSKNQFYGDLAAQVCELQARPARLWQSVEESSLDAWFEKYDAYNAPDRSISYYNKGQILGVPLDLSVRDATDNHKSLDDVLRRMNDEYAKAGKFYDESDGIRQAVEEVTGQSYEDFFHRYVSGTTELPYAEYFSRAGLDAGIEGSATMGRATEPRCLISESSHPSDRQRRIREGLLRGETN